jgi:hypothetical protein
MARAAFAADTRPRTETYAQDAAGPDSVSTYVLGYLVLVLYYWQGLIEARALVRDRCTLCPGHCLFQAVFWFRFNLKFRDPNMTAIQIIVAFLVLARTVYLADQVHAQLLMFTCVVCFWLLQPATGQLLGLGLFALASYAAVVALLWHQQPDR